MKAIDHTLTINPLFPFLMQGDGGILSEDEKQIPSIQERTLMKTHKLTWALTALTTSLATATLSAAPIVAGTEIGVDFGEVAPTNTFNGAAVASAANGSISSLIDTSATAVDLVGLSWATGGNFNNSDADETKAGQPGVFNASNLTDWLGAASGTGVITLTFTGLDDSLTYDLLIGAAFSTDLASATWTADGQTDTTNSAIGSEAFVTLSGLSTDGSGTLVITSTGAGGRTDISTVAALTLTAVPEPGSLALLGMGGLLALRRRRN